MTYDKELAFAKALALEAGGLMLRYFRAEDIATEWKEDNTPLTIADTTINRLVIEQVKAAFPGHGVLGEEESFKPEREIIWVVDPIDGTVPFSLGIPMSTFSIALVNRKDGQPVVAVTYDPWLDELFIATKGGGAFLNDKPIAASRAAGLGRGYVFVGLQDANGQGVTYKPSLAAVQLRDKGAKILSIPSGVYLGNRIATGQFIGGIIGNPRSWDVAASALLIEEAGGVVTDLEGKKRHYDHDGLLGCVLAANQAIFEELMEIVRTSK